MNISRFALGAIGAVACLLGLQTYTEGSVLAGPIDPPAELGLPAHSYYLLNQSSWTNSEAEALGMGGHLAVIDSAVENRWLLETFGTLESKNRRLWIGLTAPTPTGPFVWVDNTPFVFANWNHGQPDELTDHRYVFLSSPNAEWPQIAGKWSAAPDEFTNTPDGDIYGVVELPYRRTGEVLANTDTQGAQGDATVATDQVGNYVIAWMGSGPDNAGDIYARRFDAAARAQSPQFRVNTTTSLDQTFPAIAMNPAGDFVVVWMSLGQDGSYYGIYGQRYDRLGNPVAGEFLANTTTTGNQSGPSVGMAADGSFVVVWVTGTTEIIGRRFNSDGTGKGDEFVVNTGNSSSVDWPTISVHSSGSFIISWSSLRQNGDDGTAIYGRRYDASGNAMGNEFLINTQNPGYQTLPKVSTAPSGDFVVAWEGLDSTNYSNGLFTQKFDSTGAKQGTETKVNVTADGVTRANVACANDGSYMVCWNSGGHLITRRFDSQGEALTTGIRVDTKDTNNSGLAYTRALVVDGLGNYTIAGTTSPINGNDYDVFSVRLLYSTIPAPTTVQTASAAQITLTSARIYGAVAANGNETHVSFEYGTTASLGQVTIGAPAVVTGAGLATASAVLTGLEANTPYFFRIVASNAAGTWKGEIAQFTTGPQSDTNQAPVITLIGENPLTIPPANSYADAGAVAIDPESGAITPEQIAGNVVPGSPGVYNVSWRATDPSGLSTTITREVRVLEARGTSIQQVALVASGEEAPGAGSEGGVPAGSTLLSLGTPALSDTGRVASKVTIKSGNRRIAGIYAEDGQLGSRLLAYQGQTAPESEGAAFTSFGDPLLSEGGAVAFIATVSSGGKKDRALYTDAFASGLVPVLRQNQPIPGLPASSLLKSVASFSLRDGEIVALVEYKTSGKSRWALIRITGKSAGESLVETGEPITLPEAEPSEITAISALEPASGSSGHGRWHDGGFVTAKVTLRNKNEALLLIDRGGSISVMQWTGAPATAIDPGSFWRRFGFPAVTGDTPSLVYKGRVAGEALPKAIDEAIVRSDESGELRVIASEGGGRGLDDVLTKLMDPVGNSAGDTAFLATGENPATLGVRRPGVWWERNGFLRKVGRVGDFVPDASGAPTTSIWRSFDSIALPDGEKAGPVLVAKLRGPGITAKSDTGVWAIDSSGSLQKVLVEGDDLTIGGGVRKVSGIKLLTSTQGTLNAIRSYNRYGGLAMLVTFTDRTQAIVRVVLP